MLETTPCSYEAFSWVCHQGRIRYADALLDDPNASHFGTRLRTSFAKNDYQSFSLRSLPPRDSSPRCTTYSKKRSTYLKVDASFLWCAIRDSNPGHPD